MHGFSQIKFCDHLTVVCRRVNSPETYNKSL